ncbi:cobalamin-independent methionine synthase catalytic subunit [Sinorhizobium medicae]|nr:cobalamin-independent methionine synthase catalytic subunit [Sinorhizobium medicae]
MLLLTVARLAVSASQIGLATIFDWTAECFRVRTGGGETQVHSLCYSQFTDIIPTITAMDADVISIETFRCGEEGPKVGVPVIGIAVPGDTEVILALFGEADRRRDTGVRSRS